MNLALPLWNTSALNKLETFFMPKFLNEYLTKRLSEAKRRGVQKSQLFNRGQPLKKFELNFAMGK
jgi:hypothetical protein